MSAPEVFSADGPGSVPVGLGRDCQMSLELVRCGPATIVTVRGEIDVDNAYLIPELAGCLGEVPVYRLTLDLAHVTFFGAAGIRALLQTRAVVRSNGGRLILADPSSAVRTALTATYLTDSFQIDTTRPANGFASSADG
jgi:anti-anti-sigma factor